MKAIFSLYFLLPLALQAQVYRCESGDGPVYSQLPCAENAEVVEIEDYTTSPGEEAVPAVATGVSADRFAQSRANSMEHFLTTLLNQREVQLGEIDEVITGLREFIASAEYAEAAEEIQAEADGRLNVMESKRQSIVDQYESLIREVEQRAAAQSGG